MTMLGTESSAVLGLHLRRTASSSVSSELEQEKELEEQERRNMAIELVADMQLTAEQLKVGCPHFPPEPVV